MSNRLATRIGLPTADDGSPASRDAHRFHEPSVGALARTKGSLFLLAQLTDGDRHLDRAAREVLEAIERDYYYDLSAGVLETLSKALRNANRRLYHLRGRIGIPRRAGISIIALAIRGRDAHVVKLGPASGVIVRGGRMYELPPPPAVAEEDPRVRRRRVAATLGEAQEIEPFTWQGELTAGDRLALVSRNLAQTVGVDALKWAIETMRPTQAVEHLRQIFSIREGKGSDGLVVVEVTELPLTATTHQLEPVRPAEPLAGLPDQSPVPLADDIGRLWRRIARVGLAAREALGRGILIVLSWILAFVPRRGPAYPRTIPRTAEREAGRRRRVGMLGMGFVAGTLAIGVMVANLPSASPTEAIPRAAVAREAIAEAVELLGAVEETVDGINLVDRSPERARELLGDARRALGRAHDAGVAEAALARLAARVDRRLDDLYRVTRIARASEVVNLGAALDAFAPDRMIAASDGSLWVLEDGRGRVVRVDLADGSTEVVYRAGRALPDGAVPDAPWLIATAATDVVIVDRGRTAWRLDLEERIPRRMALADAESISAETRLLAALQHRPPLEIFNLYLVDAATGDIRRWTPPAVIPVTYPDPWQPWLEEAPDLPPGEARDIRVDASLWLLHADTVTRVDFGVPQTQAEYSLDPPMDADLRPILDYRLLEGATVGERDYLYVHDAANARILAFQRADGSFVRQWMAPVGGELEGILDEVRGLSVASVADGPPVAYLLAGDRLLRVVLE